MRSSFRPEEKEIAALAFDGVEANIAVIDRDGVILLTNQGWRRFAASNRLADGGLPKGAEVGANYLAAGRNAQGPSSANAMAIVGGIEAVLSGRKKSFSTEYPCHAPSEQRWFLMKIRPIPFSKPRLFVVTHVDVTDRRLAEMETLAKQRELALALERLQQMAELIKNSVSGVAQSVAKVSPERHAKPLYPDPPSAIDDRLNLLSKREFEVLQALVRGERNSAIADRLQLSRKSISTYRSRVLEKLKVATNAELVVLFHADKFLLKRFGESH